MRMKLLLSTVAFLAFGVVASAQAADLPVKAAPIAPGYPYAASGFYWGVGVSSTAANASVANSNLTALGAGIDLAVGYQFKGGLDFIAPEVDVTYTNIGNSGACSVSSTATTSCSTNNAWEIEPLVKFGFPITTITNLLPNLSSLFPALPSLPSGVTAGNVHPYLYAGAPIRDVSANFGLATGSAWQVQPELGAGILTQWQQGLVVDTRAGCTIGNTGFDIGVAGVTTENTGLACQSRIEVLY